MTENEIATIIVDASKVSGTYLEEVSTVTR